MTQPNFCQTPTGGWLNLTYARQINFRKAHLNMKEQIVCIITWSNGDKEAFRGPDAMAIIVFWRKYRKSSNQEG
ncbi:MAG: hypothetical protein DSM106950_35330 [Stigonema ocellatum SAG 48.90 = DSM 106950]|nr:hypothetical protein [Stigonema ocellatum SAG 48.90 = DSM 106950]